MKSRKSNKSAIIVVFTIIIAIAAIFSFVPMKFGGTTYTGVWGAINMSSDIYSGVYGEYYISGDATESQITSSMAKIKSVLQEEGYQSCSVQSINGEKIRVEIGYPQTVTNTLQSAYTLLTNVAVGSFEFRSASSGTDYVAVTSADHIKKMSIADYNGTTYLVIKFNSDGEKKFEELCTASTTIYVYMGDSMQTSFTASSITDYSQMQLSITDYTSAHDFYLKAMLGSISITLDSDTKVINTMTSRLGLGITEGASVLLWVMVGLIAATIIFGLAYLYAKYRIVAILIMPLLMLDAIIACWIFAGVSSVEFSFSSLIAILIGLSILFCGTLGYFGRIAEEYALGKTIAASIEAGTKRARPALLIVNALLLVICFVLFLLIKGEIASACLVLTVCSGLNILTNVVLLPWFVSLFAASNMRQQGKPFGLKQPKQEVQNG